MKLSVILATRDRPGHLPTAIQSVLEQDDDRWELVILDNGASVEHLVPDDHRIRYVRECATGPADAYQKALEWATGDVVMPLADDDRLTRHAVQTILNGIGDAEWGYAQTAYQQGGETAFILGSEWSLEALRRDYYLGGAVFWRRALTDRLGGFDAEFDGAADYDLYLRFGEDSDPAFIPEVLYLYNDWAGTDSHVNGDRQRSAAARIRGRGRRRVSIVTPWIGHPELLDGWLRATDGADERVVIDNGGAPAALTAHGVTVIGTEQQLNLGFAESNNLGATYATGDVVVFINNDVDGVGAWVERAREQVRGGGLYGPSIGQQTLLGVAVPYVEGWCVAATRGTWETLDWWDDTAFPLPYWEDVDLSIRAARAGMGLYRAPWRIHHLGGVSTGTVPGAWDGFDRQRLVVENRLRSFATA